MCALCNWNTVIRWDDVKRYILLLRQARRDNLWTKISFICLWPFCPFPPRCHSAPPQASDPQPAAGAHSADGEGRETRAGASGGEGEEEDEADEGQSSRCCKVKSPRWIRACMHYRFPASIDPFTSKNPCCGPIIQCKQPVWHDAPSYFSHIR